MYSFSGTWNEVYPDAIKTTKSKYPLPTGKVKVRPIDILVSAGQGQPLALTWFKRLDSGREFLWFSSN